MNHRITRLFLALLIAPLTAALPFVIYVVVNRGSLTWEQLDLNATAIFVLPAVFIAYVCTIFLGLPAYFILHHVNRYSIMSITAVGGFATIIVTTIANLSFSGKLDLRFSVLLAVFALTVSFFFGLITGKDSR